MGLTRRTPLRRGKRLNPVSKKRAAIADERRELVQRLLRERPRCEFPRCFNRSEHAHELLLRSRGGSILDPMNIRMLCAKHHRHVHDRPKEATEMGFMTPSWEKP